MELRWRVVAPRTAHCVIGLLTMLSVLLLPGIARSAGFWAAFVLLGGACTITFTAVLIVDPGTAAKEVRGRRRRRQAKAPAQTSISIGIGGSVAATVLSEDHAGAEDAGGDESDGVHDEHAGILSVKSSLNSMQLTCERCQIVQPLRARHCRACRRCVRRHDHHCPWTVTCVGERNHGLYWAFLLTHMIAIYWAILTITVWRTGVALSSGESMLRIVTMVPLVVGAVVFSVLVGFHTYLLSTAQTTWELTRRSRITYLRRRSDDDNPFDQGLLRNWWMCACHREPHDYAQML